ncbi:ubiquitin family protein [Artemisia annua]|uniref:Ubiquitin family protein n=2 Tax=Artemisia annua TaxID=35608 RepID=A0A2U1NNX8_ARTAN|nr:ubiquitin family protein [Artemisia annua]
MGVEGESTQQQQATVVEGQGGETTINLNIRCSNGNKFSVRSSVGSSVVEFKDLLAQNCDVPANQQRLIYKGRILKDDQTLDSYGLQADHTIHMVRGSAPSPSTAAPAAGNANTTPPVTTGAGANEGLGLGGAGAGAPLFPGLGLGGLGSGGQNLFGAGLPEFEQVQQQLTQNPNMMRDMMNMPAIQNIINNPEIMRSMIMSNPQMRDIIDRNPELAHVLNDPAILRQTLEAARNPELMREMMRNTDRAMSNIESSPEGFNMLRRMYENVQEPFLNATTTGGGAGNDAGSNPFAALLGNQGAATQTPSATGTETTPGSAAPNSNPLPNPWGAAAGGGQTNAGTRAPNVSGLGGLGLPGLDRPAEGMPDMSQLMQNPAISQMMQSLLSNPQYMEQIIGQNPQLRSMFDSNPQLREMMQNPEVLRQLTSPQMMQQMMSLRQLLPLNQQSPLDPTQPGATAGAQNNMGLDMLMNMFGGLGAGGMAAPNVPDVPPEQLYATQLSQLQEMGFFDTQENIWALRASGGNVHAAVERLLGNFGP